MYNGHNQLQLTGEILSATALKICPVFDLESFLAPATDNRCQQPKHMKQNVFMGKTCSSSVRNFPSDSWSLICGYEYATVDSIFDWLNFMRVFGYQIIVMALFGFSACAHTHVKDDGSTQITGLVSMTIAPTENPDTFAGQIVEVNSLGVSGYRSNGEGGLVLGFFNLKSGFLKNNIEVIGDPMTIQ